MEEQNLDNPSEYITDRIQKFVLSSEPSRSATNLIKFHNKKLSEIGDVSFPISYKVWVNSFKAPVNNEKNILQKDAGANEPESVQQFLDYAKNWTVPVGDVKIIKDRYALFLHRKRVTEVLLKEVLISKDYGTQRKDRNKFLRITISVGDSGNLSEYRCRIIHRTLKNIVSMSDWSEENTAHSRAIVVQSASLNIKSDETTRPTVIKCGIVLDPKLRKAATMSADEYIQLRTKDMYLTATHKYGIRIKDDKKFDELFGRLGKAAVTIDLLEVKPSSPVSLNRNRHGCTKGASFIFYNSARLETLLRCFDEKVQSGIYEKLPPLSDIDIGLLSCEEEWELLYGYIFAFPNLIQRCVENIDSGSCGIHYLIKYLDGLVATFSIYYRRIRILTETRPHLMKCLHARVYLLKAIQYVFKEALGILNIEAVQFM